MTEITEAWWADPEWVSFQRWFVLYGFAVAAVFVFAVWRFSKVPPENEPPPRSAAQLVGGRRGIRPKVHRRIPGGEPWRR